MDLYGRVPYKDAQAWRLVDTMNFLASIDRKHQRQIEALCERYNTHWGGPIYRTWKEVGISVGNFKTGMPLSRERARQLASAAMRALSHPERRRYILEGKIPADKAISITRAVELCKLAFSEGICAAKDRQNANYEGIWEDEVFELAWPNSQTEKEIEDLYK